MINKWLHNRYARHYEKKAEKARQRKKYAISPVGQHLQTGVEKGSKYFANWHRAAAKDKDLRRQYRRTKLYGFAGALAGGIAGRALGGLRGFKGRDKADRRLKFLTKTTSTGATLGAVLGHSAGVYRRHALRTKFGDQEAKKSRRKKVHEGVGSGLRRGAGTGAVLGGAAGLGVFSPITAPVGAAIGGTIGAVGGGTRSLVRGTANLFRKKSNQLSSYDEVRASLIEAAYAFLGEDR